ncbi:hypothetical protein AUR64_10890 [Haloprofundus marisrubri]|uniref:Uncharacterized protein n=1 Tax=Haloprofundus marisrubri TaxID=1514971 RepID=A0A0W1R9Q7_9EURY|nr:hypothetical protein [Haloprofundus marisrubri]KTG10094.1 hypothetical protein AUR64_10890 [Haloprofundus marisrubri]
MSLAADARAAARERPFLLTALRAGVVNYTAAASHLDIDGETDAIATALRRYAEELPSLEVESREVCVTMNSGVGVVDDAAESDEGALLTLGGQTVVPDVGSQTAILATGEVDADALTAVLGRLRAAEISVDAAATMDGSLLVVVERRDGVAALQVVEAALEAVSVTSGL